MIDYAALDSAVGQNWYDLDPDLQARVRTRLPARGPRVGRRQAAPVRRARRRARSPATPTSSTPTRPSSCATTAGPTRSNEVVHHPATLDSKAALWEAGYVVGLRRRRADAGPPDPGGRARRRPNYLLSQADTGMVCSLGMTSGVAGLVDAYAPADVRDRLLAGLRAADLERRHRRVDVPHRARRRLRPRPHRALHRPRHRRRPGAHRRREVVLLEHRRRRHRDAGPARGRARRPGRARPLPRAPGARRRHPQPHHDAAPQAEAGHEERADRRGRVPRRPRLRAAAPRGPPTPAPAAPTPAGSAA